MGRCVACSAVSGRAVTGAKRCRSHPQPYAVRSDRIRSLDRRMPDRSRLSRPSRPVGGPACKAAWAGRSRRYMTPMRPFAGERTKTSSRAGGSTGVALGDEPSERASTERRGGRPLFVPREGKTAPPTRHGPKTPGQTVFVSLRRASRRALRETGRARPASPEKPTKTAGQNPFPTGSRIATHSTCEVIGKMSAWTERGKPLVKTHFSTHIPSCGAVERQTSVMRARTAYRRTRRSLITSLLPSDSNRGIPHPVALPLTTVRHLIKSVDRHRAWTRMTEHANLVSHRGQVGPCPSTAGPT
ncbi:hypothetical protein SUDANB140_05900 [Streptomyces sp. enrichment culture]